MEFTRKRLEEVKFKTKGKWYDAFQVDNFLDEMLVEFDRFTRENSELKEQLQKGSADLEQQTDGLKNENGILKAELEELKSENGKLKAEIQELKREAAKLAETQKEIKPEPVPEQKPDAEMDAAAGQAVNSVSHQKRIVEELEQERDELIANIKMLRRFRDNFKTAIRNDAAKFLQNLEEMESNGLL